MLEHLHIKNVALIEELDIDFGSGLNILSGETGAGKSILIDSINFVLGERVSKDFVRTGEEQAAVEALISINDSITEAHVKELGIDISDDNNLLIVRTVAASGKSSCRINGRMMNLAVLKELSSALVDVHGQHEHQSLLNSSKHIDLLDRFCGSELDTKKRRLGELCKSYKDILKQINHISGDESDRERRLDILKFQIDEIQNASLKKDEEELLTERKKILVNAEKLSSCTVKALGLLFGDETVETSAADSISKASHFVRTICSMDENKTELANKLDSIAADLDDIIWELREYAEQTESNPQELEQIENRLNLIYNLKRKYGSDIVQILDFYKNKKAELELILNSTEELEKLDKKRKAICKSMEDVSNEISTIRKKSSTEIQSQIEGILKELGMKNAHFSISMERKDEISNDGYDKVCFMISANEGEPEKELSKIASGGEMSRVMLALKTVLSGSDNIETFIFDEIDTGVSGRTAQKVAEKLSILSQKHQILCITHLPQIASMADNHYLIEKKSDGGKTISTTTLLSDEKAIGELARLIGGAKITDSTLKAASEMKQLADDLKKEFGHNV